jgi:transposase
MAKRGYSSKVPMHCIVNTILYKLKTGIQWRLLPMNEFFPDHEYSWNSVYHHYQKWSKAGVWEHIWQKLLAAHRSDIDMSSVQLDGSHTPVKRGGMQVGYQGRKKAKTSNLLFLTDNRGLPLACSDVIAGQHNDAYNLETYMAQILSQLKNANLNHDGLFLNADAGFDTEAFKIYCTRQGIIPNIDCNPRNGNTDEERQEYIFDELSYKCRYIIERTNAWLDVFKTLLVRFENNDKHWRAWHFISNIVILLRKV